MNSVGIDTFLKTTQTAIKAKPGVPPEDGGQFNNYLREATNLQQQPSKEQPTTKPTDARPQPTNREQDSAKSSDEQPNPVNEAEEQVEELAQEPEVDEVLLSAAGVLASAEVAPVTEVAMEVAVETVPEAAQTQQGQEPAAPSEFLTDLDQALSTSGDATSETALSAAADTTANPVLDSDMDANVAEQAVVAQAATQQPTNLALTTGSIDESDDEAEKPDATEHKTPKAARDGKHALAEQFVAQVAVTLTKAEITHEVKNQVSAEIGNSTPLNHMTSQVQQQTQAVDATQADTQTSTPDQDSRMPTVDRARFVQRVANAFRSAQQNDGHIQMRLSPPELGSLRIEIAVCHGVLSANLETETADARRVLLDNLPALRQRLAEQDIRIEKFDVDVRREGSPSDGQAGARDRQAQQQSQRATAQNRVHTTAQTEIVSTRVSRAIPINIDVNLDVRI
jgi:flagellar hook-length control protein FliK